VLQPCKLPKANEDGNRMLCRMPVVSLPEDLSQQLLNESETGTINNTRGPGVAVYWSEDATVRADIYVGLKLDGFTGYRNISSVDPSVKMQFALPPTLFCQLDDHVDFNPSRDKVISIKVSGYNYLYLIDRAAKCRFMSFSAITNDLVENRAGFKGDPGGRVSGLPPTGGLPPNPSHFFSFVICVCVTSIAFLIFRLLQSPT